MGIPLIFPAAQGPAGLYHLGRPAHRQRIAGYIFGDSGACGDHTALPGAHRGDKIGITADEGPIPDAGPKFLPAVVVGGDHAAAHIDLPADIAVPKVAQMRH